MSYKFENVMLLYIFWSNIGYSYYTVEEIKDYMIIDCPVYGVKLP